MRKPGGYATINDPESGIEEMDAFTCRHCCRITHVRASQRPEDLGGLCKLCMGLICTRCVGEPCDVIERKLERAEASYRARRSYGMVD